MHHCLTRTSYRAGKFLQIQPKHPKYSRFHSRSTMPLQLLPMEASDMEAYYEVCNETFKNDIMALIYPRGFTQAAKDHCVKSALQDWRQNSERVKYMKTIDSSLPDNDPNGKMVAVSKWNVHYKDRTEAEVEAEKQEKAEEPSVPDSSEAFMEEFYGNIQKCKAQVMGNKAHILLNLLGVRPDYHRRGIGAMHLKWGIDQADRHGLPIYLESSPMGKPLYIRSGFEDIMPLPLDARKWGLDHDLPHSILLRPAQAKANGAI